MNNNADNKLEKVLFSLVLVLIGAVSFFLLSTAADRSGISRTLVESIEDKTSTVMKLTSASAAASAGISAIPGDTATPIAEKLADLTGYFLIILSVLYTEKALLTLLGTAAFKVIVPAACLLWILGIWIWKKGRLLAGKLILFAAAVVVAIPLSLMISDGVYRNYSEQIDRTLDSSQELSDETAPLANADESLLQTVLNKLSETASGLSDKAADLLNRFVESVAILIVTSCILPCLGLVLIVWMIKMLFGVDVIQRIRPPQGGERRDQLRTK